MVEVDIRYVLAVKLKESVFEIIAVSALNKRQCTSIATVDMESSPEPIVPLQPSSASYTHTHILVVIATLVSLMK